MLEPGAALDEVGARRPREIVDVVLIVVMGRGAVRLVAAVAFGPGGADRPSLRDRQPDVVAAEVGKELGRRMELMAVPAGVFEHADLGKPLRDEIEVADRAGARERARHARRPRDLDGDRFTGRDRAVERHFHHGAIVGVAVVWRDEARLRHQVGRLTADRLPRGLDRPWRGGEANAGDVDPAKIRVRALDWRHAAGGRALLAHPRRGRVSPGIVDRGGSGASWRGCSTCCAT